ncbi:hypothetical protein [Streptomyces lydicamycinicus]|nr:hypothetical protein [Streptomyces lydicamycinicus]
MSTLSGALARGERWRLEFVVSAGGARRSLGEQPSTGNQLAAV